MVEKRPSKEQLEVDGIDT
jgi:hypothetical protein